MSYLNTNGIADTNNVTTPVEGISNANGEVVIVGRLIGLRDNHRFSESIATLKFSDTPYDKYELLENGLKSDNTEVCTVHIPYGTTGLKDDLWPKHHDGCLVAVRGEPKCTSNGRYWIKPSCIFVVDPDNEKWNHIIPPVIPEASVFGSAFGGMPPLMTFNY